MCILDAFPQKQLDVAVCGGTFSVVRIEQLRRVLV